MRLNNRTLRDDSYIGDFACGATRSRYSHIFSCFNSAVNMAKYSRTHKYWDYVGVT